MKYFIVLVALLFCLSGCRTKERPCKTTNITGYVKHHAKPIPYARVFMKKGTSDAPGPDSTSYDTRILCDAGGYYKIDGLEMGNYYFLGVGYDTAILKEVHGGVPMSIECKEQVQNLGVDIPVVE